MFTIIAKMNGTKPVPLSEPETASRVMLDDVIEVDGKAYRVAGNTGDRPNGLTLYALGWAWSGRKEVA